MERLDPYVLVFPQDRILVAGPAASAVLNIKGRQVRITARESPYVVPGGRESLFSAAEEKVIAGLKLMWGHPRRSIPVYALTRGEDPVPPPRPSNLQPPARQLLPSAMDGVAMVWTGGPAILRIEGDKSAEVDSGRLSWSWVSLPRDAQSARVKLGSQGEWQFERTPDQPPAPPWLAGAGALDPAQRTVRAAWLLQEGPLEWRTFAITELASLSAEDAVANEIWTAIRSGELEL